MLLLCRLRMVEVVNIDAMLCKYNIDWATISELKNKDSSQQTRLRKNVEIFLQIWPSQYKFAGATKFYLTQLNFNGSGLVFIAVSVICTLNIYAASVCAVLIKEI